MNPIQFRGKETMSYNKTEQPTAEGAGKTCHAKEMEYNHNMCAMQESCEKCEAYKVPTNEGDIAKTEMDTGRIVDMPDLSQPTAEGAEEILNKYVSSGVIHENNMIAAMTEFAALHAQRIADKMVSERDDDIFDKMNCLIGYLERWLNNPQSNNPPAELRSVIDEAIEYLKSREI